MALPDPTKYFDMAGDFFEKHQIAVYLSKKYISGKTVKLGIENLFVQAFIKALLSYIYDIISFQYKYTQAITPEYDGYRVDDLARDCIFAFEYITESNSLYSLCMNTIGLLVSEEREIRTFYKFNNVYLEKIALKNIEKNEVDYIRSEIRSFLEKVFSFNVDTQYITFNHIASLDYYK